MELGRSVCIAIDGEAAAGKSTLGKLLAEELGFLYFDTGVMYRAVTLAALQRDLDCADEAAIAALTEVIQIEVVPPTRQDGRAYTVCTDGEDVTWALREPAVDASVSVVAANADVRRILREEQRSIARAQDVVMVGRDIGTAVMPEADVKIFMHASVTERARRRHAELQARGEVVGYEDVLASMQQRDYIDSHRAVNPLRAATDAVILDTDRVNPDEVLARALEIVRERIPGLGNDGETEVGCRKDDARAASIEQLR